MYNAFEPICLDQNTQRYPSLLPFYYNPDIPVVFRPNKFCFENLPTLSL